MSDQSIEISEIQKNRFYFTNREITMLAAFLVLLIITQFIWFAGPIAGAIFQGILWGIVLTTAAIVLGKKYTILTLGVIYTLITFPTAHMYGGTLVALSTLAGALVLEAVLQMTRPYASDLKLDLVGMFLFGLVSRTVFASILIYIYGMVLPLWAVMGLILPHLITYPIGGYFGYKMGKKVKNILESV